jgi:Rieske Fe-S protein
MERSEFISKLGLGMLVCAGCGFASCGSKNSDPTPAQGQPPPASGSGTLFTSNLSTELPNIGDSKVADGVILVRIAGGNTAASFTAVQVACTHQGTAIAFNTGQDRFICPLHGSEFSTSGAVLLGPAVIALQEYKIDIAGNTLTVSS